MESQINALKSLGEKVETGKAHGMHFTKFHYNEAGASFRRPLQVYGWSDGLAVEAYNGSLDAAHSLHKAVLGDRYEINLAFGFCHVFPKGNDGEQQACTGVFTSPARAWLLAIIKAKIQEIENATA